MAEDPLQELLLDADEVDRTELAQGLRGILGIDNKTGRVVLKPGFNDLDSRKKVLAYLMGAKVGVLLGKAESEVLTPTDISNQTGMPKGTVNPKLTQLYDERLVSKTKSGSYYVAPHQIQPALREVRTGAD